MSKVSLQMYTVRKFMETREDFLATLKKVAAIGYKNVQIRIPAFMTVEECAAALKDAGLKAESAMSNYDDTIIERLPETVKAAQIFDCDLIRTSSIPEDLRYSEDGYHAFARKLNEAGKAFTREGLKLTYHFHAFEHINFPTCTGMDILLNETDPRYVYFQPDVFWLAAAGKEPSQALKDYKGRCSYIHIKDYAISAPTETIIEKVPMISVPVGEGNLNWPGILKTAEEIGVTMYVMEDDLGPVDPFESAATSLKNLRKMGIE